MVGLYREEEEGNLLVSLNNFVLAVYSLVLPVFLRAKKKTRFLFKEKSILEEK